MSSEPIAPSDTTAMLATIERMGNAGQDPTAMYALFERMMTARAKQSYAAAMNRCQEKLQPVMKDMYNTHTRSYYAKLDSIVRAVRDAAVSEGLSLSVSEDTSTREGWIIVVCDVTHVDGHVQTFKATSPDDASGPKGGGNKSPAQGWQSGATYATKRLIAGIFNLIVAEHDTDGNAPVDSSLVTDDQAKALADVITASGRDLGQVLIWIGQKAGRSVATLADVPASLHAEIMRALAVTVTAQ